MSETTLNPPNLADINKDLASTVAEEMQKNARLRNGLKKAQEALDVMFREYRDDKELFNALRNVESIVAEALK